MSEREIGPVQLSRWHPPSSNSLTDRELILVKNCRNIANVAVTVQQVQGSLSISSVAVNSMQSNSLISAVSPDLPPTRG
ncbi:hypothetical protein AB1N83_011138 [Pleurotus pulmonarius]